MRSSEASGAGAPGFRAGKGQSRRRLRSPVTLAVATTAFLAAGLFILHDAARTFDDLRDEFGAMTSFFSIENNILPAKAVASAAMIGPTDRSAGSVSAAQIALAPQSSGALAGLLGRGVLALLLAGAATLTTTRRFGSKPDPIQRDNYRQLASAMPLGVACWTRSGELIVCNDNYIDRLGIADGNMTYHEAVRRLMADGRMTLVSDGDSNRLLELYRGDGTCLLIDERPLGEDAFMTLVSDVTERKRTHELLDAIREDQRQLARRYHEEKLRAEAASRAKTNFLAHLSHDIRTPLNHIIGFAELMQHETYGPLGDDRYADYVDSIKSSGQHLLTSFAAILDLAELEGGQKPLRQEPVLLDEVMHNVVQRFRGQMQRAGIRLTLGPQSGAVLRGDRLGLTRMLGNIVDNAVRFTRMGGQVTIATYVADDGVVIEVSDTGIGMSEERLASLSQPFALGDAAFTREGSGPGLGIAIARAIAELSGGHIAIDSTPMLGTTVAVSLPLEPAAAELVAA